MERRQFIKIVCGFVGAWPLGAEEAQQPGNQRLIGVLGADATAWGPWTVALTARLRELGWSEGDTVAIEYRWAQGRSDRVSELPLNSNGARLTSSSRMAPPLRS